MMAIIGGLLALVVVIVVVVALTGDEDAEEPAEGDRTTSSTIGSTEPAGPEPVQLPDPPPGATLTEPTECPPAEGATERVQVFAGAPPMCIDESGTYTATFATSHGEFTAQLDAAAAPGTVNNFVVLARYRYFDGVPFHRIVSGFVIQGGDGDGEPWGNNDLGYTIPDELPADSSAYSDYSLAMANSGPDTNGSQFFVVLPGGGAGLGPSYSRFGEVVEGQDVVDAIGAVGDGAEQPTEIVLIESVTITEG
jgi:cyclophilin family peptidyl-prolyl cis-trans isomerase